MIYLTNILRAVFQPQKLRVSIESIGSGTHLSYVAPGGSYQLGGMRCPVCQIHMKRSDRKEDWHVDPTGNAQYSCANLQCTQRPRYRRVDVLEQAMDAQSASRAEKQAQEHESWERLVAMENRLTLYLRDKYKGYFRGQFPDVAEIAIYVISSGRDGKVTNPIMGQTYDTD